MDSNPYQSPVGPTRDPPRRKPSLSWGDWLFDLFCYGLVLWVLMGVGISFILGLVIVFCDLKLIEFPG